MRPSSKTRTFSAFALLFACPVAYATRLAPAQDGRPVEGALPAGFHRLRAVLGAEEPAPKAAVLERAATFAERRGTHDLGPDFVLIVEPGRSGVLVSRRTQAVEEIESMCQPLLPLWPQRNRR